MKPLDEGKFSQRVEIWGPHLLLIAPMGIVNVYTYDGLSWGSGERDALPQALGKTVQLGVWKAEWEGNLLAQHSHPVLGLSFQGHYRRGEPGLMAGLTPGLHQLSLCLSLDIVRLLADFGMSLIS